MFRHLLSHLQALERAQTQLNLSVTKESTIYYHRNFREGQPPLASTHNLPPQH